MSDLLVVDDLVVTFGRHRRVAVDHVSFSIGSGERLGLIGESGSGKSVTALAIMGLLPENAHVSGSITFDGQQIVGAPDRELATLRGDLVSMVFQEPMTALDPTMRVGRQIGEVVDLHQPSAHARPLVHEFLRRVGLEDAERIADSFPHQLSGGQRQRVLVAMALINRPDLVICDEPTTALDVTVQAKLLKVLDAELVDRACLFISHDLAVMAQVCSRVAVMLRGQLVETGELATVMRHPQHPYTRGLIASARIGDVAPGQRLPTVGDFYRQEQP